jgi:hypothetical protein
MAKGEINKPVILMDVDGVVMPWPGIISIQDGYDQGIHEWIDQHNGNPNNFPLDRDVEMPSMLHPPFSSELVKKLGGIVSGGGVQFYWLTSWNRSAPPLAQRQFGWEFPTEHIEIGNANKFIRAQQVATVATRGIVWCDDDLSIEMGNRLREINHVDNLLIQPDSPHGLTRSDIAKIEEYIQLH